jgi:glycosyltransferase involved in cell wall biosynthesis
MKEKINVLHVTHLLGVGGGAETTIINLLLNLNQDKYNLFACNLWWVEDPHLLRQLQDHGIRTITYGKKPGFHPELLPPLVSFIRKNRIHILHTHMFTANLWGRLGGMLGRVPVIISHEHNPLYRRKSPLKFTIELLLSRFTGRIIAVAQIVKDSLVDYHRIDPDRISVIYNTVNTERFDLKVDILNKKKELAIDPDRPLIGVVARMFTIKGHEHLFESIRSVKTVHPDALFLLVGDGPEKDRYMRLTDEMGIRDNVFFLGLRKDIGEILQIIDFFALSSLGEGLSLAILEAMAAGKAVLATDVGGNGELVIHGETGFLVPSGDTEQFADILSEMIDRPDATRKMGRAGRERVRSKFTLEQQLRSVEALYDSFEL